MSRVPESSPKDVGARVPVSPQLASDTYTYDYIVVGGGTAGCVLASRLSEDPSVSVLLIERGPVADTWGSRVPVISADPYGKETLANRWWSLRLEAAENRYVEVVRGEGLGGSSRINAMLYTRGTPGDYNQWKALGNHGWGYDDLEPHFIKSEKCRANPGSKFRGNKGPWENRENPDAFRTNALVDVALQKLGIPHVPDFNSPDAPAACTGVLECTMDTKSFRHSTFRAFLPPELTQKRKAHLKIVPNTIATRIEFAGGDHNLCAIGVHFEGRTMRSAPDRYYARARREIVLCAGALGSPQILMLSGIGPKEHLFEKRIAVVRDMPAVGGHLRDHLGLPVMFEVPLTDTMHHMEVSPAKQVLELIKYLITGGGLFSASLQNCSTFVPSRLLDDNGVLSVANPRDLDASLSENSPDIELMHIPHNTSECETPDGIGVYSLMVGLIRPKSEGVVRLATSNPRAMPNVDLGYLTNPEDYIPLRKGVRLVLRVVEDVRKQGYPIKGLAVPDGKRDEGLDRFIRSGLRTCYHYTSTCRMGAEIYGERPSVVDTQLRVHGIQGLRVCDASVFPEIIGSHTMAPVVMVAEKCADLLKGRQHA
ncbi:alcohol oxidase [Ganoderma leucocontextum]|nr:alcohol oxidase [Ganoderma leucocontextum]